MHSTTAVGDGFNELVVGISEFHMSREQSYINNAQMKRTHKINNTKSVRVLGNHEEINKLEGVGITIKLARGTCQHEEGEKKKKKRSMSVVCACL